MFEKNDIGISSILFRRLAPTTNTYHETGRSNSHPLVKKNKTPRDCQQGETSLAMQVHEVPMSLAAGTGVDSQCGAANFLKSLD